MRGRDLHQTTSKFHLT